MNRHDILLDVAAYRAGGKNLENYTVQKRKSIQKEHKKRKVF